MNNKWGLDVDYFEQELKRLQRDLPYMAPDAMARACFRLGMVASDKDMLAQSRLLNAQANSVLAKERERGAS